MHSIDLCELFIRVSSMYAPLHRCSFDLVHEILDGSPWQKVYYSYSLLTSRILIIAKILIIL